MATELYPRLQSSIFPHDKEITEVLAGNFDHHPFLFRHGLQNMELFQLPALLTLAEKAMRKHNRSHYEAGDVSVDGYFGAPPKGVSIVNALEEIESGKNWVILKRIHEEPDYRAVLEQFITELSNLTSIDIRADYYDPIVTVFITSPNRIVPYHMDGEANFLAQVSGTKHVYLYNGDDRSILSDKDLERYWTGHFDAAKFREDLPEGSWSFQISPGLGVFNPAAFPHWVKNGNEVSISVSLNIKRRKNPVLSAYRTNYYLRSLGLKPTSPGRSGPLDNFKHLTFGIPYNAARNLRRYVRTNFGV